MSNYLFTIKCVLNSPNDFQIHRMFAGTLELGVGGAGGAAAPGGARGAKVPFQFKGLPWQNSELSEMLVEFFYEFASENARNAVIELQE